MRISDYIVEYLIKKGITDTFGYPGGMVTQLMESFRKYRDQISAHVTCHEQGAAFAACGYAQGSGKIGVAYATSGPGATNLITGICNAYFDSIPTLFITGQVNTMEARGTLDIRQRGFQETDIVSMVKPVTKYAAYVENPFKIKYYLDIAFTKAKENRMGPVLLDIPMNIFSAEVDVDKLEGISVHETQLPLPRLTQSIAILENALNASRCPCIIIGNGVKAAQCQAEMKHIVEKYDIPVVTSMIAFDVFDSYPHNYGFIGAYGDRAANFIVAKSDLIISVGSRLDVRQVGGKRTAFAPNAKLIRFDVDPGELEYSVHNDEIKFCLEMHDTIHLLDSIRISKNFDPWISLCDKIRNLLYNIDQSNTRKIIEQLSAYVGENTIITTDVGQNQVWIAQFFRLKKGQKVLFSGGHGAMGYSLPAAIGACYAHEKRPTICITGDGGLQMNIQELQFVARERLPIKIVVLNNNSLGMIRHFQEMYFNGQYFQTKPEGGYTAPNFSKIAQAYGIESVRILDDLSPAKMMLSGNEPTLTEILIKENTYVFPKLEFGKPNQDQEPLIDRDLYEKIMKMEIDNFPFNN